MEEEGDVDREKEDMIEKINKQKSDSHFLS